ncbi:hypothetical protein ISCGN_008062 [Ixodes scapularis]
MNEEITKAPLNVDLIQDRMMRTFQSCQEWILSDAGALTVLEEFPAMTITGMLLQDVKLPFGKDIRRTWEPRLRHLQLLHRCSSKEKNVTLNLEELLEGSPDTDDTHPSPGK